MAKEKTEEEVRNQFLKHALGLVDYWASVKGRTEKEKISGAIFSILVLLDGGTELPEFLVIPNPHPSDKEYNIENDKDWFPQVPDDIHNKVYNIGGCLHEYFSRMEVKGDEDE